MDLSVQISRAEVKGATMVDFHCRAEAGDQILVESRTVALQEPRWPCFEFHFTCPSPSATLLFTLFDLSKSSSNLTELGHCVVPLSLGAPLDTPLSRQSHTHTSLIGKTIAGADISKFVGKVWFRIQHNFKLLSPPVITQQSGMDHKSVSLVSDLLSRESSQTSLSALPSESAQVLVIFHTFCSSRLWKGLNELLPIACVGNSMKPYHDNMFSEAQSHAVLIPILKPVPLLCDSRNHLELYVSNGNDIIFSATHAISSLTPFVTHTYHWQHNWNQDPTPPGALNFSSLSEPGLLLSMSYTPPQHEFPSYEGLELLVQPPPHTPAPIQDRSIVVCAFLIDKDSKMRAIDRGSSSHPPFVPQQKKGPQGDAQCPCNVSVLRYTRSDQFSGKAKVATPAYFLYGAELHFSQIKTGKILQFLVYCSSEDSSRGAWWEMGCMASARVDLSKESLQQLRGAKYGNGVYWELGDKDLECPEGMQLFGGLSGVLRWKTKSIPFLTPTVTSLASSLPRLSDLCSKKGHEQLSIASVDQPTPRPLNSPFSPTEIDQRAIGELETTEDNSDIRLLDYEHAITQMAADILRLRQDNVLLQSRVQELQDKRQSAMETLITAPSTLEGLSKNDLICKVLELEKLLTAEMEQRSTCQDKLNSILSEKNETEAQLFQLQEVHSTQQKLLQTLQSKLEKYRKCSEICQKQEWLITQLESLMTNQVQGGSGEGRGGRAMGDEALSLLRRENVELRSQLREYQSVEVDGVRAILFERDRVIQLLKVQLSKVTNKCQKLEEQVNQDPNYRIQGLEQSSKMLGLEQKLLLAETRMSVLSSELQESARKWAIEKAQYMTEIAEYRARLELGAPPKERHS